MCAFFLLDDITDEERDCAAFHISSLSLSFRGEVERSERATLPSYTQQLFVDGFCADCLEVFVLKVMTGTAVGC